jgi:hypothetical protein
MVEKLVPSCALAKVKLHLRQHCRKPAASRYVCTPVLPEPLPHQQLHNQEIPNLPPFGALQSFHEHEFINIILYGTPGSCAQEMEQQGFDPPMAHTAEEVVALMEQLESAGRVS